MVQWRSTTVNPELARKKSRTRTRPIVRICRLGKVIGVKYAESRLGSSTTYQITKQKSTSVCSPKTGSGRPLGCRPLRAIQGAADGQKQQAGCHMACFISKACFWDFSRNFSPLSEPPQAAPHSVWCEPMFAMVTPMPCGVMGRGLSKRLLAPVVCRAGHFFTCEGSDSEKGDIEGIQAKPQNGLVFDVSYTFGRGIHENFLMCALSPFYVI